MRIINESNIKEKLFLSRAERIVSVCLFAAIAAFVGFVRWTAVSGYDLLPLTGACGFKDSHALPCPTCGMTTSFLEMARGHIISAFVVQPAGPVLFVAVIATGIWTLMRAIRGVESELVQKLTLKYIIIFLVAVVLAGWVFELLRG